MEVEREKGLFCLPRAGKSLPRSPDPQARLSLKTTRTVILLIALFSGESPPHLSKCLTVSTERQGDAGIQQVCYLSATDR